MARGDKLVAVVLVCMNCETHNTLHAIVRAACSVIACALGQSPRRKEGVKSEPFTELGKCI